MYFIATHCHLLYCSFLSFTVHLGVYTYVPSYDLLCLIARVYFLSYSCACDETIASYFYQHCVTQISVNDSTT